MQGWKDIDNVLEQFFVISQRCANQIAMEDETCSISYSELDRLSNRIANNLLALHVSAGDYVGICLERSTDFVATILAVYKLGAAYVPLDPEYPQERLGFYVADTQVRIIVSRQQYARNFNINNCIQFLFVEQICGADDFSPNFASLAEQVAYVIHTSGSTGNPKGVVVTQKNLLFSTYARVKFYGDIALRYLCLSSFSFDSSVAGIFWTLCTGGTLVLVEQGIEKDIQRLAQKICEQNITHVLLLPSLYQLLLKQSSNSLSNLHSVIVAGERLSSNLATEHLHKLPEVSLYNEYGPTECTVWSSAEKVQLYGIVNNEVPIGSPIPGAWIILLDKQMQEVQTGQIGEIYIGGPGVSRGYLNRPELLEQKFPLWVNSKGEAKRIYRTGDLGKQLQSGKLLFQGRLDFQVKIRGYRVELEEIESHLLNLAEVLQAVVALNDHGENSLLIGYLISGSEQPLSVSSIRNQLLQVLPEHMIPTHFIFLSEFPLMPNGKVDRARLPLPNKQRPNIEEAYIRPRDALQQWLVGIWSHYLNLDSIGIKDRFFELGGTSLIAAKIINDIQAKLGEPIYIVTFFNEPTIERYAEFLLKEYPAVIEGEFKITSSTNSINRLGVLSFSDFAEFRDKIPRVNKLTKLPLKKIKPAVFILSPPRSGTTLLRVMLSGHHSLYAANELQLLGFNDLAERHQAYSGQFSLWQEGLIRCVMDLQKCSVDQAREIINNNVIKKTTTRDFFSQLQEWVGDRTIVDKSPSYVLDSGLLETAEQIFDGALYIHLVRHPYTMIESFAKMHLDQVMYLKPNDFNTWALAELIWTVSHQNTQAFLAAVPKKRQFQIKYEDLVINPKGIMEALCQRFNWPFDDELLQPYNNLESKMTDGIYADSKPMGDPHMLEYKSIEPAKSQEWKAVLNNDFLCEETWNMAAKLGYERVNKQADQASELEQRRKALRSRSRLHRH